MEYFSLEYCSFPSMPVPSQQGRFLEAGRWCPSALVTAHGGCSHRVIPVVVPCREYSANGIVCLLLPGSSMTMTVGHVRPHRARPNEASGPASLRPECHCRQHHLCERSRISPSLSTTSLFIRRLSCVHLLC